MLRGYIDDSGNEPSMPTFVLGGYVLPAENWARFADDWDAELRNGKPISCLHMKHLGKHERGDFDGWEIEEIEDKLLALATVIQSHRPMCLAVHAQWSEYDKFAKQSARAKYIQNPYKALFHEVCTLTH